MEGESHPELVDDRYGSFDEHPHATVDMHYGEWMEGLKEALEYRVGPPFAWEYHDGTVYLWGEHLDHEWLEDLSVACNDIENEHASDGIYDAAESASRAESKILDAEVQEA